MNIDLWKKKIILTVMNQIANELLAKKPLFVGSLGGENMLSMLGNEARQCCDLLEIRWDYFYGQTTEWRHSLDFLLDDPSPLLHTARVPAEGGKVEIPVKDVERMASKVRKGDFWDVELATWCNDSDMRDALIRGWNDQKLVVVLSFHDFSSTPPIDELRRLRDRARDAQATIFKVATQMQHESDIDRLVEFQNEDAGIFVATMGMGLLGAESRIRCALAGSTLNYGFVGTHATAPGQWEVGKLQEAYRSARNKLMSDPEVVL